GQYYRFLTSMFLHAGLLHIGFNAYALFAIGQEAERIYGTLRFLALYFIAGFAGGVASYTLNPSLGVGASGAIFGLIGGLAAFYYVGRGLLGDVARQQLGSLITVILINLFIGFSTPIIDNTAHIGGLIGGAAVGWMLAPRFTLDERLYPPEIVRRSWPLAWPGALGLFALLVFLVMMINPPLS
ncbi:MAG TPA: rhomboid family intramembrane serine protease, partial [Roseiflexaceae bacterium]|nr:rhomboid family intramembrane serine protease [Roseiflexaceae bacterium]